MDDQKLRILVVEDHPIARKMAVMTIKPLGYKIETATTGNNAITQFKQYRYDLIFMDIGLPDIDGYMVTETIRKLEVANQTHTPIIALTAHSEKEFRQNALVSGMDDFLSKPLTVNKAKEIIDKYAYPTKPRVKQAK